MLPHDERDLVTLAKTLEGEARGEPDDGKAAIAWVIRNRAQQHHHAPGLVGKPGAIAAVCLAPWQFSCWNTSDPNRKYLETAPASAYAAERAIAEVVLASDGTDDPTNGADHYHTEDAPAWAAEWPPDWASDNPPNDARPMREVARFGGHVFYNSRLAR
jgi:spore germination cell wall hydrolase CwlJ-like protein